MFFAAETLKDVLGTIAIMSLLSVAYGFVMRRCGPPWIGRLALGAMFGGASMLAILDPLTILPGVTMDLRALPIVLAGAFLGVEGALVAVAMAMAARVGIGGAGMQAGLLGLGVTALAGVAWAGLRARWAGARGDGWRRHAWILGLAALSQANWAGALLLPAGVAWPFLSQAWPAFAPFQMLGVLVVGACLDRERVLLSHVTRLSREGEEDALTGLLNRRGFERQVALARQRSGEGILLVGDIDHFKRINDRHGHAGGDDVLRLVGPRLRGVLRPGDLVARLGGEEIGVFLPGHGAKGALEAGQRLVQAVRGEPFVIAHGEPVPVTISLGGARAEPALGLDALIARADAALYEAKGRGRDRCLMAEDRPVAPSASQPPVVAWGPHPEGHPGHRPGDQGSLAA